MGRRVAIQKVANWSRTSSCSRQSASTMIRMSGGSELRCFRPKSRAYPLPRLAQSLRSRTSAPHALAIVAVSSVQLSAITKTLSPAFSCCLTSSSVGLSATLSLCAGTNTARRANSRKLALACGLLPDPSAAATISMRSVVAGTARRAAHVINRRETKISTCMIVDLVQLRD